MRRTRRSTAGLTLVEVMVATAILLLSSLSLAYAFTSSGLASRLSDQATVVQASLENTGAEIADVPYHQLLSWNGVTLDQGDHTVTVATNVVRVGLILVELTVVDDRTDATVARMATYRAAGA